MKTSRDNPLWLALWSCHGSDVFHQKTVNTLLRRYWPDLEQIHDRRVFVPLCGKSLDMIWLAQRGCEVIGVELSPIAVKAFFRENHLQPAKRRVGAFTLWEHGHIHILCGDYFLLRRMDLGHIDTVYDRAALTALPENIRKRYVTHLQKLVPGTANIFLLTVEDAEEDMTLEQARDVDKEILSLYSTGFHVKLAHVESVYESDPGAENQAPQRTEYKVYQLISRSVLL
jgi:thiopurine S-methyltransferase